MRLLICAGGTGGGVYPALAVYNALLAEYPDTETLWVGGKGGMEAELVQRQGIRYDAIPAAGVHGIGLKRLPGNLWQLAKGVLASRRLLQSFKPDVLFFTGGYVAFPMAVAGRAVPTLLYVPDIEPGLALKSIARFSDVITLTTQESRQYFNLKKRFVATGYPVRTEISTWDRDTARKALSLHNDLPVVLCFGGSKGARSINMAVLENLPNLLSMSQLVHISGNADFESAQAAKRRLPEELLSRYHVFAYLHEEMGAALSAADLVISRAGASTLGEFPLLGIPSILVPYPYAWRYQKVNADYLAQRGAALILEDAQLKDKLFDRVKILLDNPAKLGAMQDAARSLAQPQAAQVIARQLRGLAEKSSSL